MKALTSNKESPELGSKVGIVAPAHSAAMFTGDNTDPEYRKSECAKLQESLKETVREQGFNAYMPNDSIAPPIDGSKWSNTAEERARHIINMLNDPSIDAIIQVNGGACATDVAHILDEYDKSPEAAEKKIAEAWKKGHPEQELPKDFFTPRLDDEYYKDSEGQMHGLPKRGIPMVGFSDGSVINNVLGQRGVVRSYYGNPVEGVSLDNVAQTLTQDNPQTKYNGLVKPDQPNAAPVPDQELPINSTVLLRLASTAGTDIQFHLDEPSILAIESIESPENIVRMLTQAKEAGLMDNVKAMVIGRVNYKQPGNDQNFLPVDTSKNDDLAKFIKNSDIPILLTQGDETFGHGDKGITKTIANLATAKLTANDGKFDLSVTGHAPQETLDKYYASSKRPAMDKAIEQESITEEKEHDTKTAGNHSAVVIDQETLRYSTGTDRAVNTEGKVCVISSETVHANYIHQSIIQGMKSGVLEGAKAVVIAVPEDVQTTEAALKRLAFGDPTFTKGNPDEQGRSVYFDNGIPTEGKHDERFDGYLTKAGIPAEQIERTYIKKGKDGEAIPCNKAEATNIQLKVSLSEEQEKQILDLSNTNVYSPVDSLNKKLEDAQQRYMGDIPVYLIRDKELSQFKGVDEHARLSIDRTNISVKTIEQRQKDLDALNLEVPEKGKTQKPESDKTIAGILKSDKFKGIKEKLSAVKEEPKEKFHTEKMVDMNLRSPKGSREI